jgi:hypothetical protein
MKQIYKMPGQKACRVFNRDWIAKELKLLILFSKAPPVQTSRPSISQLP